MDSTYDAIVVGGGVMGCSILYHLAKRGAGRLLLLERATIGAGSTGRSSGVIRMHYSTEVNTRLARESLPVFVNWQDEVGHGDSGWVQTGFMVFADEDYLPTLTQSVEMQRGCGVNTSIISNVTHIARKEAEEARKETEEKEYKHCQLFLESAGANY